MKSIPSLLLALLLTVALSAATVAQNDDEERPDPDILPATAEAARQLTDEDNPNEPAVEPEEQSDEDVDGDGLSSSTFAGLRWRGIGPALKAGRIADLAVNPRNPAHYFAAVASGGVWKTTNAGITFEPVFDGEGSYSIGCVTMDPHNPHVIWVGTGENNGQRSVSWGDGVYRSRDGGKSWTNVGLPESEHIGMITIDPRDSDVVYVAAQGPLWRSGGDRGLYKTTDGGETWERILHVSDDTGMNEVHLDPRDPDVIYASAWQHRRHVFTLLNGGPESAIYKSTDAGKTWRKLTRGIPSVDKGRIGLDISPVNPDVVYAIIEAAEGKGGFFRSTDRGETWQRRSGYMTSSPQYYNEILCDPKDVDRVYAYDVFLHVTEDGGASFERMPRDYRHVDDHALWINPDNTDHMIVGCDGGIYDTYDRGRNWRFMPNLPITQFYRVTVDNSEPFYYIYGGTQDNNTLGGPTRTINPAGITNEDWFVTVGGDGYETQVDPTDPNIVYSLWQYGGLVRHDRRSGETVDIKPREPQGEAYRWNWDTPLLISPHDHKRLYVASNKLFRSNDRGNSWDVISPDLTRQIDRNQLEVMGRIWSPEAVAKHHSTSMYGNCVALDESPLVEGLIYVGTDDGLIQVTEDGGETWREIALFPDVPDVTYVSCVRASLHDPDTVYATFDNHKRGDFTPYILRSTDRGKTWESIVGDLESPHVVYSIIQDHEKPELLFAGTEFGVFFTLDEGEDWIQLKSGIPTIAVQDIDIQRRENDVALGTFGRGFYILDDYTPLRHVDAELLEQDAVIFPVKDALRYIETSRLGGRSGRGSQGASYYAAPNPPYGAVFTYYLKDKIRTLREQRKQREKQAREAGETPRYPSYDELRVEDEQRTPRVFLIVRDADGNVIRRVEGSRSKGIHRAAWDLRWPSANPTSLRSRGDLPPWRRSPSGPLALPGTYTVTLAKDVDGELTELTEPVEFDVIPLELATFAAEDKQAAMAFQKKVAGLQRAVRGALRAAGEAQSRINHIREAFIATPGADPELLSEIQSLEMRLNDLLIELRGDRSKARRRAPTTPSILSRVRWITGDQWYVTSPPTQTQRDGYRIAGEQFEQTLADLRTLMEQDLPAVEAKLEDAGAPWTPGRIPTWSISEPSE